MRIGERALDSEIVGLVPAAALPSDPERTLLLRGFDPAGQVLERLIDDATAEGKPR